MMLAVGFSYMAFIMLRYTAATPTLLSVFYHKWVLYLIKCFFCINWYDHVIFVFPFVYMMYYICWCVNIVPCIPGMNPTWSWCMVFLMYCCMRCANILLRILASRFISDISLKFSFFVVFFPGFEIRMMLSS